MLDVAFSDYSSDQEKSRDLVVVFDQKEVSPEVFQLLTEAFNEGEIGGAVPNGDLDRISVPIHRIDELIQFAIDCPRFNITD